MNSKKELSLEILDNLEYIVDEIKVLDLKDDVTFMPQEILPTTSLLEDSGVLYGRDKDVENIVKSLLSDDVSASTKFGARVIPILGRIGIGKSALARLVKL